MQTNIAQIISLACHGNAVISGREIGNFFPNNSTCKFCERIDFVLKEKKLFRNINQVEVAKNPDSWFKRLTSLKAKGIYLTRQPGNILKFPDRISTGGIGGGEIWTMVVVLPAGEREDWREKWEVGNKDASDERIWRVTYSGSTSKKFIESINFNLSDMYLKLSEAIHNIDDFAQKYDHQWARKPFGDALKTLDSKGKVLNGYHRDLAPTNFLSDEVLAIFDACQCAWLFGGMGSWNDIGIRSKEVKEKELEQREYERVSEGLFQTLGEAIVVAVKSTYPH
jgi:hypothetical protein